MNWTQLLMIGAQMGIGCLFGDADVDGVDGFDVGDAPPTPDDHLGSLADDSSSVGPVTGTPWYANIVDEAKADIAKIESGNWTDADQAALNANLHNARAAYASEVAMNHIDQAHFDYLSAERLRSAHDGLFHASTLANDAQSTYESAIQSHGRETIRSAAGQLAMANESVKQAAAHLKRMTALT
ncbi:MAG: hypothetical protein U0941_06315 [Planctomycetaceae bacterium]